MPSNQAIKERTISKKHLTFNFKKFGTNTVIQSTADSVNNTLICSEPITAGQLIGLDDAGQAIVANSSFIPAVGLSIDSGAANDVINYITNGEYMNSGFTLTIGELYLGNSPQMTNTVPNENIFQKIGYAISATKILLNIKEPMYF